MAIPITEARIARRLALRAWLVWALGSLSFAFAFFQRVAPSVMVADLMRDFAVGAAVLGNLSAIYFYVYAGLQIPIGLLLDRFGPRRLLALAALIAGLGALVFGAAQEIGLAYLGRFLVGLGSAVGLIGTVKLVSHWFPPERFATMVGLIMPFAMIGGVVGQAPLALLVGAIGWRAAVMSGAAFALLLAIGTWVIVRDRPDGRAIGRADAGAVGTVLGQLRRVARDPQYWLLALFAGSMSGPMLAYGALWGVPHLVQVHGLERPQAALLTSLMLIGGALGGPLAGRVSDRLRRRRLPMAACAATALVTWCLILYLPGLPFPVMVALLPVAGAMSGSMAVSYAVARDLAPPSMTATVAGFVNTAAVGAGAVLQPLLGLILDAGWSGAMADGARVYSAETYTLAFSALPLCGAIALLCVAGVRESFPKGAGAP